jgi:hypothetical protein
VRLHISARFAMRDRHQPFIFNSREYAMANPPPADLVVGWAWKGASYCRNHKPRPESNRVPAPVPIFISEARRDYQVCVTCGVPLVPIEDADRK